MHCDDLNIKELLNGRGFLFSVPNYQRYYVWEENEISVFLKDAFYCFEKKIADDKAYRHFFGQMIFRTITKDESARKLLEIVDGQQRLTTFELTAAAVCRIVFTRNSQVTEDYKEQNDTVLKQIRSDYLFSYPHSENMRRKIVLSKRDNPLLIALIKESFSKSGEEYPSTTEPKYESGKRIVKAFNIIYDQINKYFANLPDEIVADRLKLFLDTIAESLSVAVIWSEDPGYSYALFQIVNDRGVLLTPAELLKARTMELLSPNKKLFETCEAAWDDILDDPGKDTKKYLSWYYTAKTANKTPKTVRAEKMHEAFEIDIFNTYGKRELGENEQAILAKEVISLQESVKKCRVLAEGKIPLANISPHINNLFYALVDGLKNDTAIPVFLNALEIQNEKTKIKLVNALTVLLAKFFFVAKTASNLHAGSIKSVYAAIAKEIQTGNYSIADFESKCREKIKKKNCTDTFNSYLAAEVYHPQSTNTCKYLLYVLDLFFFTTSRYSEVDLLSLDEANVVAYEKLSTEHIAARGTVNTDGVDISVDDRNRLGNLTLLGGKKNSEEDTRNYLDKTPTYQASPFAITRDLAMRYPEWNYASFKKRQDALIEKAKAIFEI